MSVATSQQQVFLRLLRQLAPHWRRDDALPRRIQQLLARERSFGSRDRRLYRELLYTTLRYLPWIEPELEREAARALKIAAWLAADTRDTRAYREETCADWPTLSSLAERATFLKADAAALLPAWFRDECPEVFTPTELAAQLARAPLWLRLQTERPEDVRAEFEAVDWRIKESPALPSAWRILGDGDVTKSKAYTRGLIEIQDLGSQLVLESVGLDDGERWLDACAGAGGKTLQLARLLGGDGSVDARARAERAGLENVRTVDAPEAAAYDGVLVDAPCSGSGTWRRSPHLKWTTTPAQIVEKARLQQTLLDKFSGNVRPGGRLVYATCSLSPQENAHVVDAFLAAHPEFQSMPLARNFGFVPVKHAITILPARHDTDGFFVAALRRR